MTRGPVSRGAVKPLTSEARAHRGGERRQHGGCLLRPVSRGRRTRTKFTRAAYVLASTDNTACTTMPGAVRQASRKDSQSSDVLRCEPIGGDLLRRWLWLEALALALALARARALALARARALALARARALALARARALALAPARALALARTKAALALARARALAEHARHGALRRRSVCQ